MMIKSTLIFTTIFCLISVFFYAQEAKIIYKAQLTEPYANQIEKDKKRNPHVVHIIDQMYKYEKQIDTYSIDFELKYSENKSYMSLVPSDTMGISIWDYDSGEFKFSLVMKDDLVVKDFTTDSISVSRFRNASYCVRGAMPEFDWIISSEHKEILCFPCIKATSTYQGKEVVAWFTPSIPIPDGPLEYQGLPGLILELSTWDNVTTYKAIKVKVDDFANALNEQSTEFQCKENRDLIEVSSLDEQWQTEKQIKTQNRRKHANPKK